MVECELNVSREWVMDSICTFHIYFNWHTFTSLISSTVGVVLMGNNSSCKVEGIRNVSIKMFDDKVCILINVRYVYELKKNLISLNTLNSQGYKFIREWGTLKVYKGSMVKLKGHQKMTNLYVLEGNTITGDTALIGSSHFAQDTTNLWHM